ncbi:hypothetical protein Glove_256g1 [Diversispora epigaea]|uniref:Uncharacterized protein n=1 Tax=Diversispora epigaea TaxID=1348612 RepID=A0A397I749_9GLOM|nr:hypothetical protein Glove_256g1 [Diversispora epigaea]
MVSFQYSSIRKLIEERKIILKGHLYKTKAITIIDAGHLPDVSNSNPMTTNNYTERINRTIESRLSGKYTFIERLYGLKLLRENLNERGIGQITYETGLVTLFNTQSIEQQNESPKITSKMNRQPVELEKDNIDYLKPMTEQLAKNCNVELRDGYYITNIVTGECPLCLDCIWNGPFHDVCKHCHVARVFSKAQERVVLPNQKNNIIYLGSIDEAYEEIICLFNIEAMKTKSSIPQKISSTRKRKTNSKQIENHYKETINSDPKKLKINSIATVMDLSFIETRKINSESTIIVPEIQFTTQEPKPVTNLQSQYKTNDPEFAQKLHTARQYVLNIMKKH